MKQTIIINKLADIKLNGEFENEKAEMEQLVGIGLWCFHLDLATRPKMRQVVKLLKLEDKVPNLPIKIAILASGPI